ncbi:MAG: hypothetical protein ACM3O7_10860 [Acidobacteriota bacterium]
MESTHCQPPFLLLAAPDDYLLELERSELEAAWLAAHPGGEAVVFDETPAAAALIRELASPSLFATDRLLVVRDGHELLTVKKDRDDRVAQLAATLSTLPLRGVGLILAAVADAEPKGPLADVFKSRGELRFLPIPPPPKPWEPGRVTPAQRQVLERVITRVAPEALDHPDAVEALCERYGFQPRELAAAAQRLVLAGEITPAAVRDQAGVGDCSLKSLEDAVIGRDRQAVAGFFSTLHMGGSLLDWWDKPVDADKLGRVLSGSLGRTLRAALALRGHSRQAGIEAELDPARCSGSAWYPKVFKNGLFPRLSAAIEATPDSPVAGLSAWSLHRSFRVAAAYRDAELLAALSRVTASGAEWLRAAKALTALAPIVVDLVVGGGGAQPVVRPPAGAAAHRQARSRRA